MEKRLIEVAHYLFVNDALGYHEALNLMCYCFGYEFDTAPVNQLFREVELRVKKGIKPKEFPKVWNSPFIFN